MIYQSWGLGTGANFQTHWLDSIRAHGSIPMVTWEPWDYTAGVNQPTYSLTNIINGNFDAYLTQYALDAKAWGHPFFLRFAHEMNGNWYSWSEGVNGNTTGQYVQAWRHVHDIFSANGVTNVSWTWSPNVEYTGSTPLVGLYPGDTYVDWLAMDGYNWGTTQSWRTWQSFTQIFGQTYAELTALSNKPLLVAETASTEIGGSKAQWITNALTTEIFNFPRIKGFIWFNESKETDWRIESSSQAKRAYRSAINNPVYASNIYSNLNTSPIGPPQ